MALFKPGEGGRPKGVQNKITIQAKEAFQAAFDAVGGLERLQQFALENYLEFIKIYSKLIPVEGNITLDVKPEARVYPKPPTIEHVPKEQIDEQQPDAIH